MTGCVGTLIVTTRGPLGAAPAEHESQRKQAEFARETVIVAAPFKAEVDRLRPRPSRRGPLAEHRAQRAVLKIVQPGERGVASKHRVLRWSSPRRPKPRRRSGRLTNTGDGGLVVV
ncbi:hypothetical protein H7H78_14190 [Mycobacterium shinjukuense]|nr:hypothetical protein [Mycobacterium shinjukuense]MCV6986530.1 hypothetical protein [Mycobacterium shinjukuense]ORB70611.1 hypothetical protein BST45_05485 [Mycobacterium shinjukuense]